MRKHPHQPGSGRRLAALVAGVVVLAVSVGTGAGGTVAGAADGSTTTTEPAGGWPTVDQPGVTDDEIRVSGVASTTNPLGGLYGTSFDGVKAYFKMINKQGGIYGRKLVMVKEHDDQVGQNQREVEAIIDQDNVFAVLPIATIASFSGADKLAAENIPTFGWGGNDEWGGPPNLFGHLGALCNGGDCPGITLPWLAKQLNKHKLGVLAYNVPSSADCLDGIEASFDKYGKSAKAEVAYANKTLSFGVTDLSADVKKMVDADVDFVTTCMDTNGVLSVAKEMRQQGLTAIQYLPNGYDQAFMKKNGGFFEGSYVITQFAPFETKPKFPALKRYIKWMKKAGYDKTENATIGWINADNFVTGLKMAGPEFTRQKVIDQLNTLTDYDAGGMLAPLDWTAQHTDKKYPRNCTAITKVEDSKFVPKFGKPGKPFICWGDTESTNSVTAVKPTYRQ
ncbi:MAG: ABC transporter substrate-binding protein [Acidimicrobiia bacterium]